jgi:hypothetical protein
MENSWEVKKKVRRMIRAAARMISNAPRRITRFVKQTRRWLLKGKESFAMMDSEA